MYEGNTFHFISCFSNEYTLNDGVRTKTHVYLMEYFSIIIAICL